tara:strand:- start:5076 stop:6215 length:1140 start_codon:yes stop_codon:yes gene_type:complete
MKLKSSQSSVLLASSIHRWNDVRVYHKEARSLSLNYDVTVIGVGESDDNIVISKNISVILLPFPDSILRRIKNAFSILAYGISPKYHLIHFHDPELIWVGLILRLFRKKVIYDVHEDLKAAVKIRRWVPHLLKNIIGNLAHTVELFGQFFFTGIIVAEDSYLSNFNNNNHIISVRNYVRINSSPIVIENKSKRILYTGSVTIARGVGDLLKAIALLQDYDQEIGAIIIGHCPTSEVELFHELKDTLPNPNAVEIVSFIDFEQIQSFVSTCSVAVVPLRGEKNYEYSIPTKILDYMNWGIPYIYSRLKLTEELFGVNSGGIGFDPGNIVQLENAIHRILTDLNLHKKLTIECRNKIHSFNWISEEAKLFSFYETYLSEEN